MLVSLTLIYTNSGKLLISKLDFDIQFWKDKLYYFKEKHRFENIESLNHFLKINHCLNKNSIKMIVQIIRDNDSNTFQLSINNSLMFKINSFLKGTVNINILPLGFDLLQLEGLLIDWKNWVYFFQKKKENYHLWVYLGGIAELIREIILDKVQIKSWQEKGNRFIEELAFEIQHLDSMAYTQAVEENRRIV